MNSIKRIVAPSRFEIIVWLYFLIIGLGICYYYLFTQAPEVKQYFDYQRNTPSAVFQQYDRFGDIINQSKFAADAAVFMVWAGVGLLGYIGTEMLLKLLGSSFRFSALFFDKRLDKEYLVESTLGAFLMKLVGVTILLASSYIFIGIVFPLAFLGIHMLQDSTGSASMYISIFATLLAVIVHIVSICMRLIVQRERVFFGN